MRRRRHALISAFVIAWTLLFHYETLRAGYLGPLAGRELPKTRLLFPPAGWIMFFSVDKAYGFAEVYGLRAGEEPRLLDPHDVFATRAVGYDNTHRNVLVSVLHHSHGPAFCGYLTRKFPAYDGFAVVYAEYPDVTSAPDQPVRRLAYRCQAR